MTPDTMQRLGSALADRYRIDRELGAGGMAPVYLADDLRHERQVAIKVLACNTRIFCHCSILVKLTACSTM